MNSYGQFAYSYDLLTQNVDYEKRGRYIYDILLQYGKDTGILVDLACGTGSMSEYFARLNYDVIGIDASEEMLEVAAEKKRASGSDIIYICQKMQNLDLFGTVDIVICTLDSLNHITDGQELKSVFERILLFMNPGALFIFDVNTVYKHENILADNTFVYDFDEVYCVWQNSLREDHIVDVVLDIFEYQEEEDVYERYQEAFSERAYADGQLEAYLSESSFEILGKYAENSFDAPTSETQRTVYVCRNLICRNRVPQKNESI